MVDTPLVAAFTLTTAVNDILNDATNGSSHNFQAGATNPFTIDENSIPGFSIKQITGQGNTWWVTVPEGKYVIVASVEINLDNPNPSSQGTPIFGGTGGSGTYLNGLFIDLIVASYNPVTNVLTSSQVLNQRSEQYAVATVNQPHHLIYVTEHIFTGGGAIRMSLGRSSGTTVNDTVDMIPNKTKFYIYKNP